MEHELQGMASSSINDLCRRFGSACSRSFGTGFLNTEMKARKGSDKVCMCELRSIASHQCGQAI